MLMELSWYYTYSPNSPFALNPIWKKKDMCVYLFIKKKERNIFLWGTFPDPRGVFVTFFVGKICGDGEWDKGTGQGQGVTYSSPPCPVDISSIDNYHCHTLRTNLEDHFHMCNSNYRLWVLQQPPLTTNSTDHSWATNFDDQFWALVTTFNNKLQRKSTSTTTFARWISDSNNKLLRPTLRSLSCNQLLPPTTTYNCKLWRNHLRQLPSILCSNSYFYDKLKWKPHLINFNDNHLSRSIPTFILGNKNNKDHL